MSKYLITGVRKGDATANKSEYDIQIDGGKEVLVEASTEIEAIKNAQVGKLVKAKKSKGRGNKK